MIRYHDIVLGITTRGRLPQVEAQGRSLRQCKGIDDVGIVVVDDCNDSYGPKELARIYPKGARIYRTRRHSGAASLACRIALELMTRTERPVVVILDCDLICAPDFLDTICTVLPRTKGFFSLFNTPSHPAVRNAGDGLLEKDAVGAAGCVMRRQIALDVLNAVGPGPRFDWRMCTYLKSVDVPVLCLKDSAVQHIGFAGGQNSGPAGGDFGAGFGADSDVNTSIMFETIVATMQTGFRNLAAHLDRQRRQIARLEAEIAALKEAVPNAEAAEPETAGDGRRRASGAGGTN
jgi:hypothetical protein